MRVTLGRLRIRLCELREARGLSFGERHDLRVVAGRILLQARGAALRNGQHAVGVGLRFLHEALLIGERLVRVALRGDHRIGNLHVGQVHGGDGDSGIVEIERALDELLGALRDVRARRAHQHVIERALADDLAEGALGDAAQRRLGVGDFEQHLHRIGVLVLDGKAQLDEIDVGR